MRKCILTFIILTLIVLTGCVSDPATYYFDSDDLIANTVKIEKPEMIEINEKNTTNFDYNTVEVIGDLDHRQFESFIVKLSSITFHKENFSVNKPIGKALILHQKNGDMLVLSCTLIDGICYSFVSKFDSNNNYITHIAKFADRPQFESLLDAYFVFG